VFERKSSHTGFPQTIGSSKGIDCSSRLELCLVAIEW
jgi:hypothetical protein